MKSRRRMIFLPSLGALEGVKKANDEGVMVDESHKEMAKYLFQRMNKVAFSDRIC